MIQLSKPIITKEEKTNVLDCLNSGLLARGPYVTGFEDAFARYTGTRHALSASSGTAALEVALQSLGIGKGRTVITTPFSFIATSNAVIRCGGRIAFADIDPATYNICPAAVEKALKKLRGRADALLITHLYGLPCKMDDITRLARKYKVRLIEDCAQAHGAEFCGRKVGSFGDIAIFSFYGSKNMTTGEGGMITTNNSRLAAICGQIIDQGRTSKYIHGRLGSNHRMSNILAAIGVAQLKKLDSFNRLRIRNAGYLTQRLCDIDWLTLPATPGDARHVFHLYTVSIGRGRDRLIAHLKRRGVAAAPNYPIPIHKQPIYKALGYGASRMSEAEKASRHIVNLPAHPGLKKKDLDTIVGALRSWKN